jgi:hypothetical protein
MPQSFSKFVGQPILAAAGFQPALEDCEEARMVRQSRLERRLRAKLPAPHLGQNAVLEKLCGITHSCVPR